MILRRTSKDFRNYFLLLFTNELIKNSIPKDLILQEAIKEPEKGLIVDTVPSLKEKVEERIFEESKKKFVSPFSTHVPEPEKPRTKEFKPLPQVPRARPRQSIFRPLRIPQNRLPPHLQYIKPVARENMIDLGKLQTLMKDPFVAVIECNGEGENVITRGRQGAKVTNISLTDEEIGKIIQEFSVKSKIPVGEGVYRVAVGRLILAAIISEITGTKFVISKMGYR